MVPSIEVTLRNPTDARTVLWVFLYYAVLVTSWVTWKQQVWYTSALAVLLNAYFSFSMATITHNTMHCRVFKENFPNKVLQVLLSVGYGHCVSAYVPGHNLSHHRFAQKAQDMMRTTKMQYKWHLLNGLLFHSTVVGDVFKADLRYMEVQRTLGRKYFENAMNEMWTVTWLTIVLLFSDWKRFLLFFYIPHLFAQWGIVSINVPQHDGCEPEDEDGGGDADTAQAQAAPTNTRREDKVQMKKMATNVNSARNFTGWLLNYLTFNNGYHMVHHMYPTMHWSKYPDLHKEIVEPYNEPALNQPCLARYIWRTFVYPGVRVDYKMNSYTPKEDEVVEDEDWMQYPKGHKAEDYHSSGALKHFAHGLLLFPFKLLNPIFSPGIGSVID